MAYLAFTPLRLTGEDQTINSDIANGQLPDWNLPALPEPVYGSLTFTRTFWVIAAAIFANQVFQVILWGYYGFGDAATSHNFLLISAYGGVAWYLIVTVLILEHMDRSRVIRERVLGISWAKLRESSGMIIKYFAILAAAMTILAIILPAESLLPDTDQPIIIVPEILSCIVLAPICEEIWFRGYLYPASQSQLRRPRERVVVNAMLFAGAHVFLMTFFIGAEIPYYIFVVGFFIAQLYETTRSILPGIVLHALNNGLALTLDYLDLHSLIAGGN